jgi:4-hydroxy-4-methyl-2-oxoglutarate aldolase
MIVINPRQNNLADELIRRYRDIAPATIGHLLEFGFPDPAIQPIWRPCKMVGPAFTIRTAALDSSIVHLAIDMAEPGDVLVLDRNGENKHACWGGMTTLAAKLKGLAGVVVDGCVTDFTEITEFQLPVYARSISAITTRGLAVDGEINTQVQIGGAPVNPGDLVVADSDGIVVMPPDVAARIIDISEEREKRGLWIQEQLKKGAKISELSKSAEKIQAQLERQAQR